MPDFVIKTHNDRNIVIEADRYEHDATEHAYAFFKKDAEGNTTRVATLRTPSDAFLIIENSAEKADFYFRDDEGVDPVEEDDCVECQLADEYGDLLESEVLWNAVWDIVEAYHEPDEPASETGEQVSDSSAKVDPIQHWRDKDGEEWWGFQTPKGFVHFGYENFARDGYDQHQEHPETTWAYLDLTGATRLD